MIMYVTAKNAKNTEKQKTKYKYHEGLRDMGTPIEHREFEDCFAGPDLLAKDAYNGYSRFVYKSLYGCLRGFLF